MKPLRIHCFAALALMLCLSQPTLAAVFTVNTTDDTPTTPASGTTGTLRQAVLYANSNPGTEIQFDSGLTNQTIALNTELPSLAVATTVTTIPGLSVSSNGNSDLPLASVLTIGSNDSGTFTYADDIITGTSGGGGGGNSTNSTAMGTLIKTGTNTLRLTGTNTYGSDNPGIGTQIQGGTISGTTNSLNGTINGTVGTSLVFDQNFNGAFTGTITGGTNVIKTGSGSVNFSSSGPNIYFGGTVLNAGTLQISNNNQLGDTSGTLAFNGGTLAFNTSVILDRDILVDTNGGTVLAGGNSTTASFLGNMNGAGSLTLSGAASLTYAGTYNYTGFTHLTNGMTLTLAGDSTGFTSDVQLDSGTTLIVATNSQAIGSLAGDGSVVLAGSGGGNATVVGNLLTTNNNSTIFNGAISGTGSFTKDGTGTLTLTGISTFTGGTLDVNGGTVQLDGQVAALTVVGVAGTLSGSGTVNNSGTINGTIAPGHGLGNQVLTFNGSVSYNGATQVSTLNSSGTSDHVVATGTASVANSALRLSGNNLAFGTTWTVLHADGGVTGQFDTVNSTNPAYTFTESTDANNIFVTLKLGSTFFSQLAMNQDQKGVASAFGAVAGTGNEPLLYPIANLPPLLVPAVLQELSGDFLVSQTVVELKLLNQLQLLTSDRNHELANFHFFGAPPAGAPGQPAHAGLAQPSVGQAGLALPGAPEFDPKHDWSAWARGFGVHSNLDSSFEASGLSFNQSGAMVGVDRRLGDNAFIGLDGGFFHTDSSAYDYLANEHSNGYVLGFYGGYKLGDDAYLLTSSLLTHSDNGSTRNLVFGAVNSIAVADFSGNGWSTYAELGKHLTCGSLKVDPMVSLEYDNGRQTGFTEAGAGAFNLSMNGTNTHAFLGSVGVRVSKSFVSETSGTIFTPEVRARYVHDFDDDAPTTVAAFPGLSPTLFTVRGAQQADNYALLGASLTARMKDNWDIYISYNGQFSSEQDTQSGEGGFRVRF